MSQGIHLRKYGVEAKIDFELYEVDGVNLRTDAIDAGADCNIMKDEGNDATCTNDFVDEGMGYSITLTAAEMQAARIVLYIIDSATKVWLDKVIVIETYGNASAQHAMDFDDAVRGGMTALPAANADAAGGLPISDAGGLDIDAMNTNVNDIETDTNEIQGKLPTNKFMGSSDGADDDGTLNTINTNAARLTAARAGVLTDWIDDGRLDALLDLILEDTAAQDTTTKIRTLLTGADTPVCKDSTPATTAEIKTAIEAGGSSLAQILADTGTDGVILKAAGLNADAGVEIAAAVWDRVITKANHNIANSAGKKLRHAEYVLTLEEGTAQAGSNNTITLEVGANANNNWYLDSWIILVEGTGVGQLRHCMSYDGGTRIMTVGPDNWITNPASGTDYIVVARSKTMVHEIHTDGLAQINAEVDTALSDYGANTTVPDAAGTAAGLHTTTDGKIDGLNNITAANVRTEMETNGGKLDHLWETTEDDAGVRRFTENALEEAPSGAGLTGTQNTALILIRDIIEGDATIDTSTTPWQLVVKKKSTATEVLKKNLKDISGNNIGAITTIIAQQLEP